MKELPLYHALQTYINQDIYPFHMPGHKQGRGLKIEDILKMDVTEVEGLDNLHHPTGVIEKAQQLTARTFGAEDTYFLVNGSTGGLLGAITAVCKPGDMIITARNCHRSVFSGMIVAGVRPKFILPEIIKPYGLTGGILPETVERALKEEPEAKAVILVSPTYEGFTSDIKGIAKIVHRMGKILIVDEAHGAHFTFNKEFPTTALEAEADVVIQSVHKTLPALTQSAMLHVQGNRIDRNILKERLSMLQSSSPSYLLMAAMDICRYNLDVEGKKIFREYLTRLKKYRNHLYELKGIQLLGKELEGTWGVHQVDISKLVFYCGNSNKTGIQIDHDLRHEFHIQMEMASPVHLIAMTTIADEKKGYERLTEALKIITSQLKFSDQITDMSSMVIDVPESIYLPREASFMEREYIPLSQSQGYAAAEFVIPYPPGIPLVCPGEKITEKVIQSIIYYRNAGVSMVGMKDPAYEKIQIIKSS